MEASTIAIEQRVELWMRETIRSGGYRSFADLHIDQIHPSFTLREGWIPASFTCLEAALRVRNRLDARFVVAVGMSLRSGPTPQGVNFTAMDELASEIDWSPPSLYLFEKAHSPWASDLNVKALSAKFHIPGNTPTRSYFHEWWDSNDAEFRRAVWITG